MPKGPPREALFIAFGRWCEADSSLRPWTDGKLMEELRPVGIERRVEAVEHLICETLGIGFRLQHQGGTAETRTALLRNSAHSR